MEAVRNNGKISSSNVTRVFLKTSEIDGEVYVNPLTEACLPRAKVWEWKRSALGLIDAAQSFFINYADDLISLGCEPCSMNSATFYHYNDGSNSPTETRSLDGMIGIHIDED